MNGPVDVPASLTDATVPAVDQLLASARARISPRVDPSALEREVAEGALLVDIRPEEQRRRDGCLEDAVVVERNVLEWRLDCSCPHRMSEMQDPSKRVVIVCNEGYASSLAAATLRELGLTNVTDLAGGYQAWLDRERRS
jgi:rhodanese-related sulfurtransferase